jgi:phloretin hydrolase
MNPISTLLGIKNVFPKIITNEFINSMPRRELTEEEKALPYSKYYYKDMARIPQEDLDIVNRGPVDPILALPISRRNKIMESGYLPAETGYCLMPDGSGFAATKVFMPGVTTEMIDWWFNWHPLAGLRYAIWCPVAHKTISALTPEAHLDSSNVDLHIRNIGKIHYPVEGFNLEGAQKLEIAFKSPEQMGFDKKLLESGSISTFETATVTNVFPRMPINIFFHAIREVEGGVEYRSRYWLRYTFDRNGNIVKSRYPLPKSIVLAMARNNCIHSLTEYNNLASILPSLYKETAGEIAEQ